MRVRGCRSLTVSVLLAVTTLTAPADAQDADALRGELQQLREQFATITRSYEQRLKELSERLQQLESRGAAPEPRATVPTLADLARPRQPFELGQPGRGRLLFDIGRAAISSPTSPRPRGSGITTARSPAGRIASSRAGSKWASSVASIPTRARSCASAPGKNQRTVSRRRGS